MRYVALFRTYKNRVQFVIAMAISGNQQQSAAISGIHTQTRRHALRIIKKL
jgi:hypothetical protein